MSHVLVVDDDALMLELEADILEEAGHVVAKANGGRAAIESLKVSRPDLVLLDIVMPGVNGWDVLRHLGTLPSPPRVIIATGLYETVPPGALARHVAGYLFKPFRGDDLVRMCADVLAAPLVIPASGARKEPRRTCVVQASVRSADGGVVATGRLLDVSRAGFRFEVSAPVEPGDAVIVSFLVPGEPVALELRGDVRWRGAVVMGAEMVGVTPAHRKLLGRFVEVDEGGDMWRGHSSATAS